jgi:SAM-dependent methyltransferase
VLRQLPEVPGQRVFASDYNPVGVDWARTRLPAVSFATNNLQPPLPYPDDSFDLCYAVSVFTHLPAALQEPWLRELHRVLRPHGVLLVTLSGEGDIVRITPDEQKRFFAGELVVIDPTYAGTNLCGVYHPFSFVEKEWSRYFRICRFLPRGAGGTPYQDLYVLEKIESSDARVAS